MQTVEKHLSRCTDSRSVGDWRCTLREVDAAIASGADASPQVRLYLSFCLIVDFRISNDKENAVSELVECELTALCM